MTKRRGKKLSRGERNCRWIEEFCVVPEGKLAGQKVKLRKFQRRFILRMYDNPHGTRRAILSFGRKNGKTAIAAMFLLLHLCGPESVLNGQLYSAAQSRDQAALTYKLASKMVRMNPRLASRVECKDSTKELVCANRGTAYRALSAEAATAYGASPFFLIHDELGQVKGPHSELYEALETAVGAQDQPLSVIISTQAPTDAALLSVLIDDALENGDPRTVIELYTAPVDLDPFAEETVKLANPAYGIFQNAVETMGMAEDAKRMPSREPNFRNLILNQRVETTSPFLSRTLWAENNGPVPDDFTDADEVYIGLDLSDVNDLTAKVAIARLDGKWRVRPVFWLPHVGLRARALKDRVPYDVWHRDGFLETTPGRAIRYQYVASQLRRDFDRWNVVAVGFDRWNMKHLKPWLQKAKFTDAELERFVEFGQGFQSMSPALRTLEEDFLMGEIAHADHPVLKMCAVNAVTVSDPAGNRKLAKNKSSGRIDGMVALAMARAVAGEADAAEDEQVVGEVHFL